MFRYGKTKKASEFFFLCLLECIISAKGKYGLKRKKPAVLKKTYHRFCLSSSKKNYFGKKMLGKK